MFSKRGNPAWLLSMALTIAAPIAGSAATPTLTEQRILAQQGMMIGATSSIFETQLNILIYSEFGTIACNALTGGGGLSLSSSEPIGDSELLADVGLYFDKACKKPYIVASDAVHNSYDTVINDETAIYYAPNGTALGKLTVNVILTLVKGGAFAGGTDTIATLAKFTPATGASPVALGFNCVLGGTNLPCQGAIAQNFPKANLALGSITPLAIHELANDSLTLSAPTSSLVTGALGKLSVDASTPNSVGIAGTKSAYGTAKMSGSAGGLDLFPPPPTAWSITDTAHDAKFTIAVVSSTARNSKGTITQISTGKILATIAVDQSGTGSIEYSDGSQFTITNWLLAD
jgi:hypothetical protein